MTLPRIIAVLSLALATAAAHTELIPVAHKEGTLHGYLALRSEDGKRIGTGEIVQTIHGDRVTARLLYRFTDGSIDDEHATFTQRGNFHLLTDHHLQKGPSFPHPMDVAIDVTHQQVTVRSATDTVTIHMDLPEDLSNGDIIPILKNINPANPQVKLSYLAANAKPRLVHLAITPMQSDPFHIGALRHKAQCLLIHVELGGVAGVVAPLIGKQPADVRVWIEQGEAPAFIREEGPFYEGGPTWTVELTSPTWSK